MLETPRIDYTDKDYNSLRRAMLEFADLRLPEWTDRSQADFGMLMVDLFAYVGDVVLYYQDRIANELLLDHATERRNIINLLRLIGYELAAPTAATVDLDLDLDPTVPVVTIPTGTVFGSANPSEQSFEYLEPTLTIDVDSDQVERPRPPAAGPVRYRGLPVHHGATVPTQAFGSSTGEPNQSFPLFHQGVIVDSIFLEVNEGAGWVRWDRRDALLHDYGPDGRIRLSAPDARHYYVRVDEALVSRVHFGDGELGMIPPRGANNIRASYRIGGGAAGNVPPGTIKVLPDPPVNGLVAVTNPAAAVGGGDPEANAHAVTFGPHAFRSRERAVTVSDHEAMAHKAGGVAKARALCRAWNTIDLFVAPEGTAVSPVPEALRRKLLAFLDDRRMAGTSVRVLDAVPVPIDLSIEIGYDERFRPDAVRQAVVAAVSDELSFERVAFGQSVYLGVIHNVVEDVAGVRLVRIRRFVRRDAGTPDIVAILEAHGLPSFADLPAAVRAALEVEVDLDGHIELQPMELPTLGDLDVTLVVSPT
jgi:hypothetical protein